MKYLLFVIFIIIGLLFGILAKHVVYQTTNNLPSSTILPSIHPSRITIPTNIPTSTLRPTIEDSNIIVQEAASLSESKDPDWWLSSGGKVFLHTSTFTTIKGKLSEDDRWFRLYNKSNPADTDNGKHPQNIFRLVTKKKFADYTQQVYFKILHNNFSESENRNESNGVLLFNRYQDADNLYYTGLRVDGQAVIKKKIKGEYTTLAIKKVIQSNYNRRSNPNVLTENTWYGIQTKVTTQSDGSVHIVLLLDLDNSGKWLPTLDIVDTAPSSDYVSLTAPGHLGIRSDFMDLEFKNFSTK